MITLLARWFIKGKGRTEEEQRTAWGMLCGAAGVGLNLLLFLVKLIAGTLSGSIAVTADAFNNLSDAGSSVVTLLGFQLARQKPDLHHPFGHGRAEYLSGLAVSVLILVVGAELAKSSLERIVHPAEVRFSAPVLGILLLTVAVKLYMAWYNRRIGERIGSAAMRAASVDSLSDSAATAAVVLSALVSRAAGVQIDGWMGLIVAVWILRAGYKAVRATADPLLGAPPTAELVGKIRRIVAEHTAVIGIHDLIVHDYGPGRVMISLHAEVPASGDVLELHDEIDDLERELAEKLRCAAVIHMDPVVTDDDGRIARARQQVETLAAQIDPGITIHDFRMVAGAHQTKVVFDAVVPFGCPIPQEEVRRRILEAVRGMEGNYYAVVNVEQSYT